MKELKGQMSFEQLLNGNATDLDEAVTLRSSPLKSCHLVAYVDESAIERYREKVFRYKER